MHNTVYHKNVLMDVISQGTWCLSQSPPRSVLTEDVDGCRILLSHHPDGENIWESTMLDTVHQHSVALLVELWRRLEKYAEMTMLEHIALGRGMPKDSKAIVVIDRSWPGRTLSCCEGASCMDFWREVPSKESSANFPMKMFWGCAGDEVDYAACLDFTVRPTSNFQRCLLACTCLTVSCDMQALPAMHGKCMFLCISSFHCISLLAFDRGYNCSDMDYKLWGLWFGKGYLGQCSKTCWLGISLTVLMDFGIGDSN